jgi:hypothetical protein
MVMAACVLMSDATDPRLAAVPEFATQIPANVNIRRSPTALPVTTATFAPTERYAKGESVAVAWLFCAESHGPVKSWAPAIPW